MRQDQKEKINNDLEDMVDGLTKLKQKAELIREVAEDIEIEGLDEP